ncbi:hypothetical protein F3Y22_tig00112453pilonHSYRG00053 [Hibiscus syriacus]|uniref:FCP1 homology domain-containing protein n=1 Tax=Hibiscus syriacus TaxID=106335 RepID=A0A6A2WZB6_HIBSY|nr:hypothetical protein F3Y22_tig00112453pilonHSYRG00053 [Hibiscus syriacus]
MKSMGGKIVGGADDFEIEAETRKQPKGGYIMVECKRMKEDGTQSGSVTKDVRSKWNSMSDAEKEPYIIQSRNDRVRDRPIRRELCRSLMAQFDVKQCIAKYGDFSFPLGIPYTAAVSGVENEGKSIVEVCKSKDWKALVSKYGLKQKVTYAEIEEEIKSGSYGGDELKARVLLYLVGIFLCPTGETSMKKDYMKLICDEGLKGEFNWAEYVALFDFWSGYETVSAYERIGVAHIRAWGKEEVVRVMAKLKLDRPRKQERVIGKEVEEAEEKKRDGWEVEGKIDGVVKEVKVLRGEVVKEVEVLRGDLKMVTGEKLDGVVKEVVELRSELTGVKGVVDQYLDERDQLKGEIKEMKSFVEKKYDELKKYEEEKREEEEEKMEEMRRKEVDAIYTPESVIAADLDSECPAPQKKKHKCIRRCNVEAYRMGWQCVCYDSQKSLRRIGYLLYLLAQQALDANNKESVQSIATFWGPILDNYVKFTDYEKIMITINYHNSHWYLLVLVMVDRVATIYNSMFTSEATKQRVKDAKRLIKILDFYNKKHIWVEYCRSLGKFPLKNFKFVEHKKNKQLNEYDCGMYVMMWMESIGSTGATGDFVVGEWDRSRILNDLHPYPKWLQNVNVRSAVFLKALLNPVLLNHNLLLKQTILMRKSDVDNQAVNEDEDDDEDDDDDDDDDDGDDDDDPNKYIVSATPPSRKILIFYLNGVLAYIPRLPAYVVLRIGLFEFMQFCVDNFVVAIWSSKMRHNVDRVLEKLPLFSEHFLFVWDQAKCKTYDNVTYCKDLNDVWNPCPDFNELNTLLVDDSAEKMIYNQKYNYICPHTFDVASHSNDSALEKGGNIREYLENLLKAPNVYDFV